MRPIRVGIIGAGNVLWAYLQALDRLVPRGLAELSCICARRRENWPVLFSKRPGINLVATADEVLSSDSDIVVIITPPGSHAELVRQSLEAGKHVLVEKPMADSYQRAQALVQLAQVRQRHLVCAPFVHLSPTFRALWGHVHDGEIGTVHSARGLYGNAGSTWARWYHDGTIGPLAEVGIYNLKSLTTLLGPVGEVQAMESTAISTRVIDARTVPTAGSDVSHIVLRHRDGALASIVSSHAIQRYRRPALELYGTDGTANLLGDDWDPRGFEIWQNQNSRWEEYEAIDPTWLWTDGLTEMVNAVREDRAPLNNPEQDLHLIEVIEACTASAREKRACTVGSTFPSINLRLPERADRHHLHDHTRSADEQ